MVETPTFEEVMVAFNEAVAFIGQHGLLEQFTDEISSELGKHCCLAVATYADEASDDEYKRVVSAAAHIVASRIIGAEDDEADDGV